ncbi:MAG: glycosyltransferase family 4 protein [Rickettsiales bacterium]
MRIVFAIKALSIPGGGAERVLVEVASGLAQRGHQVSVVTSDPNGKSSYYPLHHSVHQVNLGIGIIGKKTKLLEAIKRMYVMRRVLVNLKPDVAIGFMHSTYIPLGFALKWSGIPLIASEHIGTEHYKSRIFERILISFTPFLAKKITVVSEQIKLAFSPWLRRCMVAIPNPVNFQISKRADLRRNALSSKILLSVGRLSVQKDHKCLVSAFATIASTVPDWNLRIVGEGELRNELEAQVRALNLEHRVQLPGATKDMANEYLNAHLFVLPSLYESFGLSTAEAIVHGLPVVGFADCPGTNTLIRNNENGILVDGTNRIEALATVLSELMANPHELKRLAGASTDWLENMFNINSILDCWEKLIQEVARPRR